MVVIRRSELPVLYSAAFKLRRIVYAANGMPDVLEDDRLNWVWLFEIDADGLVEEAALRYWFWTVQ